MYLIIFAPISFVFVLYFLLPEKQNQNTGHLDICEGGLRIRTGSGANESQMTPFHSIAVWSAVKFVFNQNDGTAAFLPLITDPENLDKKSLFTLLRFVCFLSE